ncbi:SH3 domain-containing protein [Deminuibacter soli]|nr:hypothetical protein [Deminuibacter soli]
MINFKKEVAKELPYNREQYLDFFDDDSSDLSIVWYGISFQLSSPIERNDLMLTTFVEMYERLLNNIITKLDNGGCWIVNHEDKDLAWFPNNENNLNHLRTFFKESEIPGTSKGALVISKSNLFRLVHDLLLYPYVVLNKDGFLYKDLNISHGELKFIIKISGHLNVDFLCTDLAILREIIDENNSNAFIIKAYRGTSL